MIIFPLVRTIASLPLKETVQYHDYVHNVLTGLSKTTGKLDELLESFLSHLGGRGKGGRPYNVV